MAPYDFSTSYTKLPHDKHKFKTTIADFAFKGGNKTFIILSNNGTAYWGKKTKGELNFSEASLKTTRNHLKENWNLTMKVLEIDNETGSWHPNGN